MKTIGILCPMKDTDEGGVFAGSRTTEKALESDLTALLTLKRGHRPMQSKMYSPIYDYLHEPLDKISQDELKTKIKEKVKEFIPQLEIKDVKYTPDYEANLLGIKIVYKIKDFFDVENFLDLVLPTEHFNE